MPEDNDKLDTQPIHLNAEDFTQPVTVDANQTDGMAIEDLPLPAWILDWAAGENQPIPSRDVLLAELEEDEPFVPPAMDENTSWGSEPNHATPLAELENCLQEKDFSAVLSLVQNHKIDPAFRQEAGKAIRKHLKLDDLADPLWEANEMLNNEQSGDE